MVLHQINKHGAAMRQKVLMEKVMYQTACVRARCLEITEEKRCIKAAHAICRKPECFWSVAERTFIAFYEEAVEAAERTRNAFDTQRIKAMQEALKALSDNAVVSAWSREAAKKDVSRSNPASSARVHRTHRTHRMHRMHTAATTIARPRSLAMSGLPSNIAVVPLTRPVPVRAHVSKRPLYENDRRMNARPSELPSELPSESPSELPRNDAYSTMLFGEMECPIPIR